MWCGKIILKGHTGVKFGGTPSVAGFAMISVLNDSGKMGYGVAGNRLSIVK
jgi:hypothetical protein